MIEAWAVLGRCCVDRMYHQALLGAMDWQTVQSNSWLLQDGFESSGLRLSRWEVNELSRLLKIKKIKQVMHKIQKLVGGEADLVKITDRSGFDLDLEFYSVIGLACIDQIFLRNYRNTARSGGIRNLSRLLERGRPFFKLKGSRNHLGVLLWLASLNKFWDYLKKIENLGWKTPGSKYSCATGYFPADYLHVNQPQFEELLSQRSDIREVLADYGAITYAGFNGNSTVKTSPVPIPIQGTDSIDSSYDPAIGVVSLLMNRKSGEVLRLHDLNGVFS